RGLQRKVRRRERQVFEERLVGMVFGVILEALDGVFGDGRRGIITGLRIDGGQRLVVLGVLLRGEVAVVIVEAVRTVEAVLQREAIDVPLAGVVVAVAERSEHFGKEAGPGGA